MASLSNIVRLGDTRQSFYFFFKKEIVHFNFFSENSDFVRISAELTHSKNTATVRNSNTNAILISYLWDSINSVTLS